MEDNRYQATAPPPVTPAAGTPPPPAAPTTSATPPVVVLEKKSPGLAGVLSVFPGLGHLYLGLYYEATGDGRLALEHLTKAADDHPFPHYMGDVARVHRDLLRKQAKKKAKVNEKLAQKVEALQADSRFSKMFEDPDFAIDDAVASSMKHLQVASKPKLK